MPGRADTRARLPRHLQPMGTTDWLPTPRLCQTLPSSLCSSCPILPSVGCMRRTIAELKCVIIFSLLSIGLFTWAKRRHCPPDCQEDRRPALLLAPSSVVVARGADDGADNQVRYLRQPPSALAAGPWVEELSKIVVVVPSAIQSCTKRGTWSLRRTSIVCCCWSTYCVLESALHKQLGDGAATLKVGTDSMTPIQTHRHDPRLTDNGTPAWRTAVPSVQPRPAAGGLVCLVSRPSQSGFVCWKDKRVFDRAGAHWRQT